MVLKGQLTRYFILSGIDTAADIGQRKPSICYSSFSTHVYRLRNDFHSLPVTKSELPDHQHVAGGQRDRRTDHAIGGIAPEIRPSS